MTRNRSLGTTVLAVALAAALVGCTADAGTPQGD